MSDFNLADDFVPKFRELISIDSGVPDGLAVDMDGCIWLAVWGGSRVTKISPQGKIIEEHHFLWLNHLVVHLDLMELCM